MVQLTVFKGELQSQLIAVFEMEPQHLTFLKLHFLESSFAKICIAQIAGGERTIDEPEFSKVCL